MALVTAQFLINDNTGAEQFVVNLPYTYEYGPGERLVTREISQEQYDLFLANKQDHIKIFRYASNLTGYDLKHPPKGLDYKIGLNTRLHTKPDFNPNGFLQKMEYYTNAQYDTTLGEFVYTDKILEAVFNYTIDPTTKFVVHRTKTVRWYKEDGTQHPDQKIMFKIYSAIEMDDEAVQRRKNVIALIKLEVAMFLAAVLKIQYPNPATRPDSNEQAKALMAPLNVPVLNYINGGDLALKTIIQNSPATFFNTVMPKHGKTVRQFIVDRLSL